MLPGLYCPDRHRLGVALLLRLQGTADAVRQYMWLFDEACRDGVDAARPLCLARRQANQPAINPALLGRSAGIQPGIFDAGEQVRVERAGDDRIHAHSDHRIDSMRRTISPANSTKACAPRELGSNTTPGKP